MLSNFTPEQNSDFRRSQCICTNALEKHQNVDGAITADEPCMTAWAGRATRSLFRSNGTCRFCNSVRAEQVEAISTGAQSPSTNSGRTDVEKQEGRESHLFLSNLRVLCVLRESFSWEARLERDASRLLTPLQECARGGAAGDKSQEQVLAKTRRTRSYNVTNLFTSAAPPRRCETFLVSGEKLGRCGRALSFSRSGRGPHQSCSRHNMVFPTPLWVADRAGCPLSNPPPHCGGGNAEKARLDNQHADLFLPLRL
jgi:hypothetical protein